jgi:hypothetical protein
VGITLADSDLIKVGEQEQQIKIPNIAEALAELTGMGVVNNAINELTVNMLVRVLTETGVGRQQTIKNYYLLDVIRDYLGVPTNDKTISVPFAFDPMFLYKGGDGKDEFSKFLRPAEVEVDIEEISGNTNLQKSLSTIDRIYALCKAYMTRKVSNQQDIVKLVKDIAKTFDSRPAEGEEPTKDDFDIFLEKIEQGFTTQPGNTMEGKPYGREFTERPKIVRLTKENDAENA